MDKKTNTAIISGSIELTSIDKTKIVNGSNGKKYVNFTAFVQNQSQYGNNVWVIQSQTKDEQESNADIVTLGNAAVKWINPKEQITVAEKNEVTNAQHNSSREIKEEVDLPF